jgi:replicative DNA helicase
VSVTRPIERIPPQNLEAEQSVLGSMLLDRDAIARVVEALRPEDFYRDLHRTIFQAMLELFERGEPVDLITVTNKLATAGKLEDVGGATYLASLPNTVPTAANAEFYAGIVLEKSMLRALISAGTHIASLGFEGMDEVSVLIDQAEKLVYSIAARGNIQDFQTIKEILKSSFEKIDKRYQEKGTVTGVATGFTDLDTLTSGLQPADMVIIAARPSVGKCLSEDAEILLEDGSVAAIGDIYRRRKARLLTLGSDWKFRMTEPSAFVDDGAKPVFLVRTRLGRTVKCTAIHPFLTISGWLPLASLKVGDRVAVPRRIPVFGNDPMRDCEVKLLAYFIGDGSLTGGKATFTNTDAALMEDFKKAVDAFGSVRWRQERDPNGLRAPSFTVTADPLVIARNRREFGSRLRAALAPARGAHALLAKTLGVSPATITHWHSGNTAPAESLFYGLCKALRLSPAELAPDGWASMRRQIKNPLVRWLVEHRLWGKGASSKEIPARVFRLPREQLALFLNRLFATDGWSAATPGTKLTQIGYGTISAALARQVQHLLLRFGIIAGLRSKRVQCKESVRHEWQLQITDPESIAVFGREIGILSKEKGLARVLAITRSRTRKPNTDTIPLGVWRAIASAKGVESWAGLAGRASLAGTSNIHAGRRCPSRARLQALALALDEPKLQQLAQSDVYWDEVVSIEPAGMQQVYDLTIPDTHNFVANDICVHNTTLSLNIAQHAAITEKIPVALFSLETSKEQLVQRILCSEARVDNSKLRTGYLADEDWRKLARAMGSLSEAPIFIDDSATLSVMEMRAKARKLKAEHGLGLIVVDYIQMIQSFKRTENRTQELSEIARGIKSLAKELDVPIIAVSQLSRAVESLGSRRPMLSHLRECVTGDTVVWDADTGQRYPVADLARTDRLPRLLSLDRTGKLVPVRPEVIIEKGENSIFEIRTSTGRRLRATANHPVLTPDGWKTVGELRPRALVAAVRTLPAFHPHPSSLTSDRLRLLGYLIGDGNQRHRAISFTSADPLTFEDCIAVATREFDVLARRGQSNGTPDVDFGTVYPSKDFTDRAFGRPYGNPLREWLRELGIKGQSSYDKRIPDCVFYEAGREGLRALLRGLFSTDGCLTRRKYHRNGTALWSLHYDTVSRGLADDVRDLLLRFGIVAEVSSGYLSRKATVPLYRVTVEDAGHLAVFCRQIGIEGRKSELVAACVTELATRPRAKPQVDRLPYSATTELWRLKETAGLSWRRLGFRLQTGKTLDRATALMLARRLRAKPIAEMATNDLLWDRVVSITPAGKAPVYDLCMPRTHNFVANGLIVHNSGELEQTSDLVVFLYREDYYDVEKAQRENKENVCELIIAKHRNGPIGSIELYFHKEFSRFENLSRRR